MALLHRSIRLAAPAALAAALAGCAVGVGFSLPIPGGAVGVSVDSSGRVGGGVTVGGPHVGVTIGGSTRLEDKPKPKPEPEPTMADGAASAPKSGGR